MIVTRPESDGAQRLEPSVVLDRSLPTPLYLQLQGWLRTLILNGDFPAGAALPSERSLSDQLGLSRMTVRHAVSALVDECLLERRHGSGTYVCSEPLRQSIDSVLGFAEEMRRLGKRPESELLEFSVANAQGVVAQQLGVSVGVKLTKIVRLRKADGRPLAIQTAFLPTRFYPFSLERLLANGSLYATFMTEYGVRPQAAKQAVFARLPTREEANLLGMDVKSPVLGIDRTTVDAADEVIEYVTSAYRGDAYQLELDLDT